jgi:transglutaminase-like putative cysteine protease
MRTTVIATLRNVFPVWSRRRAAVGVLFVFGVIAGAPFASAQAALWETAEYDLSASEIDLQAVGSPPQQVIGEPILEARTTVRVRIDPRSVDRPEYCPGPVARSPELEPYLAATPTIESTSPLVRRLADDLFPESGNLAEFVRDALQWTKTNIGYDRRLAREIWEGRVDTQSAETTLRRRRGTCSEYANAFIALMRARGVPARFVSGFFVGQMYHAWAEVYLPGSGWVPVDPQMGAYGVSNRHIKLFVGVDFPAIGVKLKDIKLRIEDE